MSKNKSEKEELKFFSVRKENSNVIIEHFFQASTSEQAIQKFDKSYLSFFYDNLDIKTTVRTVDYTPKLYF
jgi:hypothetical protein